MVMFGVVDVVVVRCCDDYVGVTGYIVGIVVGVAMTTVVCFDVVVGVCVRCVVFGNSDGVLVADVGVDDGVGVVGVVGWLAVHCVVGYAVGIVVVVVVDRVVVVTNAVCVVGVVVVRRCCCYFYVYVVTCIDVAGVVDAGVVVVVVDNVVVVVGRDAMIVVIICVVYAVGDCCVNDGIGIAGVGVVDMYGVGVYVVVRVVDDGRLCAVTDVDVVSPAFMRLLMSFAVLLILFAFVFLCMHCCYQCCYVLCLCW